MKRWLVTGVALFAAAVAASPTETALRSGTDVVTRAREPLDEILDGWLEAFNSGDRERIKSFYARYADDPEPAFALEQAEDTCGVSIYRELARSPTALTVLLGQRCVAGLQRLKLELAAPGGPKLKSLDLRPLPIPGNGGVDVTAQIAERLAARDEFAGSLLIQQGDRLLLARSWGVADKTRQAAITLDTPMFLASAGKMFTAVSVLQLVDAGKIELDAPLSRYLPDYPNAAMAKVTIRQLLTHRGGTGDIGILGRDDGANRAKVRTIADMIELNGNRGPEFPPGSKEAYSNYGFILLGAVIERITHGNYYDYVREHVFSPAGMTASGFPDRNHLQNVAVGYTTFYGAEPTKFANTDTLPWRGASAGGGVATANDMLRFFDAMQSGKLLSPAMFRLATTPGTTPWYGMGFVTNPGAGKSWGHGGNSYGMDVAAHHYPAIDTTFICLGTRDMVCNRLIFAWYLRTFTPRD
jgi:CubicO group peptidase (beta-lactamase class C family)